jgi:ribosomal protein S3
MVDLHENKMSAHLRFNKGVVPLSTISSDIRYVFGTTSLKYGSLGVKYLF